MLKYTEEELIKGCIGNKRKFQHALYQKYSNKMYAVCLRYSKSEDEAKDIMQESFIKVFKYIKNYTGKGSLEGWIRRTVVNTAINIYRQNIKFKNNTDLDSAINIASEQDLIIEHITAKELQDMISLLPDGYRLVFNLNIIEGYTHKEIGDLLNISENTSKSQLFRARGILKKRLEKLYAV